MISSESWIFICIYSQSVERFKSMMDNASSSSPPEKVAKVILQAVTSESPQLRYTVGNDASALIQAKGSLSDAEFGDLIR
jgi:hypothetical protein